MVRELPDGNSESEGLVCTKPVIKKRRLARMVLPWQNLKLNLIRVSEQRKETLP
jgi:hypothetical protein